MKFECALEYLRKGHRIYREKTADSYLQGTLEKIQGSYYLTLYDILADDWCVYKDQITIRGTP